MLFKKGTPPNSMGALAANYSKRAAVGYVARINDSDVFDAAKVGSLLSIVGV